MNYFNDLFSKNELATSFINRILKMKLIKTKNHENKRFNITADRIAVL